MLEKLKKYGTWQNAVRNNLLFDNQITLFHIKVLDTFESLLSFSEIYTLLSSYGINLEESNEMKSEIEQQILLSYTDDVVFIFSGRMSC